MDTLQSKAARRLDALYRTGYPHPINLFATLMLALLPALSLLSGEGFAARPSWSKWAAELLALGFLLVWSRLRPNDPRWERGIYHELYLLVQTALISLIYALDGGLTRFLFTVVAVQAVYLIPVKRWAPFVGTVAALWLTLYLAIKPPGESGASMVASIGMYMLYLIFAALVTFTTLQQERQGELAQQLLKGVDQRHQALRAYDQTVEYRTESEERERLSRTIHADLIGRLVVLRRRISAIAAGDEPLTADSARAVRLRAKEALADVRQAVRTLRPGEDGELDDEPGSFDAPPEPDFALKVTDPIRVYHVWNLGVIGITIGVMIASQLVGAMRLIWLPTLGLGLALVAAYAGAAWLRSERLRALCTVIQAGLIFGLVWKSGEPLMNHLFLIISAQMVFLVASSMRGVVLAVAFPTVLTGAALWMADGGNLPLSLTVAFGVTYFFSAVMAFMTRRQVEARERAIIYAQQLSEVNHLLEARLQEARQVAIARERVRMARELHDGLGHYLTTVIVELQFAEAVAGEDPTGARGHLQTALQIIDDAMAVSREMVQTMERFERPLAEALRSLAGGWRKTTNTPVFLYIEGDCDHLSTVARMTIYRVVQESLTNVQKHAVATRVHVSLICRHDRITLTVTNDDVGGKEKVEQVRGGFGLIGLRERAEALQGDFQAGPRPGGGFRVSLILPVGV